MESHKFIFLPFVKWRKQKKAWHVPVHRKVVSYILRGGNSTSFIFTSLFVRLDCKSKFYVVRVQLFWKGLHLRESKQGVKEAVFPGESGRKQGEVFIFEQ